MHHPRCRRLQLTLHNEPTPLPAGGGTPSPCPPTCHHLGPIPGQGSGQDAGEGSGPCGPAAWGKMAAGSRELGVSWSSDGGDLGWPHVALLVPPSMPAKGVALGLQCWCS